MRENKKLLCLKNELIDDFKNNELFNQYTENVYCVYLYTEDKITQVMQQGYLFFEDCNLVHIIKDIVERNEVSWAELFSENGRVYMLVESAHNVSFLELRELKNDNLLDKYKKVLEKGLPKDNVSAKYTKSMTKYFE